MKILTGAVLLAILCASGVSVAITYNSYVDLDDGFDRVTVVESPTFSHYPNYTDNVLTINMSDTVTWVNTHTQDFTKDLRITLISQQELWNEKDSYLKWNTRTFSYRFEKPGVYDVYVKEYAKFHQTIVVNPIYDSFGNVKTQETTNTSVQEINDLDPLVASTPYVVRAYSKRMGRYIPGGYNRLPEDFGVFVGVLFIVVLIIGILRNTLRKK